MQLVLRLILAITLLSIISCSHSEKISEPMDPCLEKRAAFDVGSGETRMLVATIDICKKTFVSTKLSLHEKVPYKEDLSSSSNLEFSNEVKALGLETLKKMQKEALNLGVRKFSSIFTSAFREAKNAQSFVDELNQKLSINGRIITADEEAHLGFYSTLSQVTEPAKNLIVWDIGASSQQIIYEKSNHHFVVYEGSIGSISYKNLVLKTINRKNTLSPNPLDRAEMNNAIKLAMNLAGQKISKKIRDEIRKGTRKVIGIGGVHYYSLLKQLRPNLEPNVLTQKDIELLLNSLIGKTDADYNHQKHVETMVTNVALVFGFMKTLNIKELEIYNLNLTQGLLLYPKYWD